MHDVDVEALGAQPDAMASANSSSSSTTSTRTGTSVATSADLASAAPESPLRKSQAPLSRSPPTSHHQPEWRQPDGGKHEDTERDAATGAPMGAARATVIALALLLGACGGDSGGLDQVASLGDTGDDGSTGDSGDDQSEPLTEEERQQAHLDFAACMREHGVDMPDPEFTDDGGVMMRQDASAAPGEAPDMEAMDAAHEACEYLLEDVINERMAQLDPEEEERMKQQALDFAKCMREHGVDMPDPQFDGGGRRHAEDRGRRPTTRTSRRPKRPAPARTDRRPDGARGRAAARRRRSERSTSSCADAKLCAGIAALGAIGATGFAVLPGGDPVVAQADDTNADPSAPPRCSAAIWWTWSRRAGRSAIRTRRRCAATAVARSPRRPSRARSSSAAQAAFSVDGRAVPILYGTVPMWRRLDVGAEGVDVEQLEANLVALGYATEQSLGADGKFDARTASAVKKWQKDLGVEQTGVIDFGDIEFTDGAVRVEKNAVAVGEQVGPGTPSARGDRDDQARSSSSSTRAGSPSSPRVKPSTSSCRMGPSHPARSPAVGRWQPRMTPTAVAASRRSRSRSRSTTLRRAVRSTAHR